VKRLRIARGCDFSSFLFLDKQPARRNDNDDDEIFGRAKASCEPAFSRNASPLRLPAYAEERERESSPLRFVPSRSLNCLPARRPGTKFPAEKDGFMLGRILSPSTISSPFPLGRRGGLIRAETPGTADHCAGFPRPTTRSAKIAVAD